MRGEDRVASLDLIERIADALRIPGGYFRLAPRPWEDELSPVVQRRAAVPLPNQRDGAPPSPPPGVGKVPGERGAAPLPVGYGARESPLSVEIDSASDGAAHLTYRHELVNIGSLPITRLARELWFKHTDGVLEIQPLPDSDRNVIVQRVHDTVGQSRFACQIFPALQPGESSVVGYTCANGRFLDELYWRQSVARPTEAFSLTLRHQGVRRLRGCNAVEERPDGSEVSATDGLTWRLDENQVVINLTHANLTVNQAVTLRWDADRELA